MGLSRQIQIQRAEEFGRSFANSLYKDFQDMRLRGPTFTWEYFPETAKRMATVSVFMSFPHRIKKEIEEIAGASAEKEAKKLLEVQDERRGTD